MSELQFRITEQGQRALREGLLPDLELDEAVLSYVEVNEPVTLGDFEDSFSRTPLKRIATQLLTMRRMGLITQEESR